MTTSSGPVEDHPRSTGSILIVEDHELLAQALALGLRGTGFACAIANLTGSESVIVQAVRIRPALVLLDLDLGSSDGLELIPHLHATGARILVVTGCTTGSRLAAAVALGAWGWVSKAEPFERLLEAAELAMRGAPLLTAVGQDELAVLGRMRLANERDLKTRVASLTPREREVLAAMSAGTSAQDMAGRLFVSLGTIRTHIRAILMKLGVSSQLAAVAKVHDLVPSAYSLALTPDPVLSGGFQSLYRDRRVEP